MRLILLFIVMLGVVSCSKKPSELDNIFSDTSEGCGAFRVYKFNGDKSIGIAVYGDRTELGLDQEDQVYNFATIDENELGAVVREYTNSIGIFSCIGGPDSDPSVVHEYKAASGTATIHIDQDSIYVLGNEVHYNVTVHLDDVILKHTSRNKEVKINHLEFNQVLVGDI